MAMQTIEELFEHELKDMYSAEHSLLDALERHLRATTGVAVPRFRDFASAQGIPLTLFAVGADMQRADNGGSLRALAAAGLAPVNSRPW